VRRAHAHSGSRGFRPGLAGMAGRQQLAGLGGCLGNSWNAAALPRRPFYPWAMGHGLWALQVPGSFGRMAARRDLGAKWCLLGRKRFVWPGVAPISASTGAPANGRHGVETQEATAVALHRVGCTGCAERRECGVRRRCCAFVSRMQRPGAMVTDLLRGRQPPASGLGSAPFRVPSSRE
jgi:hypothetical protein